MPCNCPLEPICREALSSLTRTRVDLVAENGIGSEAELAATAAVSHESATQMKEKMACRGEVASKLGSTAAHECGSPQRIARLQEYIEYFGIPSLEKDD